MIENRNTILSDRRQKSEDFRIIKEANTDRRTITCGDTTVRLSFSDSGDLSTRLASAFNTMLK